MSPDSDSESSHHRSSQDTTVSSVSTHPASPVDLAQMWRENDRQKKDDSNRLHQLNRRLRENSNAVDAKEKEIAEAADQVRILQAKRRRLDDEIKPMRTKQLELPEEIRAAKELANETKVVALLLEQAQPFSCLERVAKAFGYRLESLLEPTKGETDNNAEVKKELHEADSATGSLLPLLEDASAAYQPPAAQVEVESASEVQRSLSPQQSPPAGIISSRQQLVDFGFAWGLHRHSH